MGGMPEPLAGLLREHRIRAGLSQQQLALRAGVSVRSIQEIESGRVRRPRPDRVRQLAEAVGVDPERALAVAGDRPLRRRQGGGRSGRPETSIAVLGPVVVRNGDRALPVGSAMLRCVLGMLAVQHDRWVSAEELIDGLWGEDPPATCRNLVHTYIARLRRLLARAAPSSTGDEPILASRQGYQISSEAFDLDVVRFDELVHRADLVSGAHNEAALDLLAEAVALWNGPALADLPVLLRQTPAVSSVDLRRVAAVLTLAEIAATAGQHERSVDALRSLAHEEPLHERLHAMLMIALAGSGHQAAALQVFEAIRDRLADELGVEPGAALRNAHLRVLRGQLDDPEAPPCGAVPDDDARPAQLPADVARFTGRTDDLRQLDAALDGEAARGVVISVIAGMAGVGKTALAVRWAHRVAERFPDGQMYVDLRGYSSGAPLEPVQGLTLLLTGLGVAPDRVPADVDAAAAMYRSKLAGKRMLIVLDNVHRAQQVRPLLPGDGGCAVLVTSRDELTGLVATHDVHRVLLGVLSLGESAALLAEILGTDRISANPFAAEALARTCGFLPLALRIAAAKLAGEPERDIASFVAEMRSGDQLAELAMTDDPHVGVSAALSASYRHMSSDCRRTFRLLGLMPGADVSITGAAALTGLPPDAVRHHLDQLTVAHLAERRGHGRYGLHDLLRLYGQQRSDLDDEGHERTAALDRLFAWYLGTGENATTQVASNILALRLPPSMRASEITVAPLEFDGPVAAAAWYRTERANIVAAVRHAAARGPLPAAWRLADVMQAFFVIHGYGADWLVVAEAGLAAAVAADDKPAQAACYLSLGNAHQAAGNHQEAVRQNREGLVLARQAGWSEGEAEALSALGLATWWLAELDESAEHHLAARDAFERLGRPDGVAKSDLLVSLAERDAGRLHDAVDHQSRALEFYRQISSRMGESHALYTLGVSNHRLGRLDQAHEYLTAALTIFHELGDRFGEAYGPCSLAAVHRDAGRYAAALREADAGLTLACEIAHRYLVAQARIVMASILQELGKDDEAERQLRRALDFARAAGARDPLTAALLGLAACRRIPLGDAFAYAEEALDMATRAGLRVLEGDAHATLARLHQHRGGHAEAVTHARQALELHRETGHRLGEARALQLLATLLEDVDIAWATIAQDEAAALLADIGAPPTSQMLEPARSRAG